MLRNIAFFFITSILVLGPNQPPFPLVTDSLSAEVKRPGREAEHSPLSTTEVENEWSKYLHPLMP